MIEFLPDQEFEFLKDFEINPKACGEIEIDEHPFIDIEFNKRARESTDKYKVFPILGRCLTQADIGKNVIRIWPRELNGCFDWSYAQKESNLDHIRLSQIRLTEITDIGLKAIGFIFDVSLDKTWVDNRWTTVEEFSQHLQEHPDAGELWSSRPESLRSTRGFAKRKTLIKIDVNPINRSIRNFEEMLLGLSKKPPTVRLKQLSVNSDPNSIGSTDRSYKVPNSDMDLPTTGKSKKSSCPNFSSDDPREILGLHPDEKDLKVINKQYKYLALSFHPDKNKGNDKIFKIIQTAHEKLTLTLTIPLFEFSVDAKEISVIRFHEIMDYEKLLNKRGFVFSNREIANILPYIVHFYDQLISTEQAFETEEQTIFYEKTFKNTQTLMQYYQIKLDLFSIRHPTDYLEISEKIDVILNELKKLSAIEKNVETMNSLYIESLNIFKSVNSTILDKYLSLQYALAEIYIQNNEQLKLNKLHHDVQIYVQKNHDLLRIQSRKAKTNTDCLISKIIKSRKKTKVDYEKFEQPQHPKEDPLPPQEAFDDGLEVYKEKRSPNVPLTINRELKEIKSAF